MIMNRLLVFFLILSYLSLALTGSSSKKNRAKKKSNANQKAKSYGSNTNPNGSSSSGAGPSNYETNEQTNSFDSALQDHFNHMYAEDYLPSASESVPILVRALHVATTTLQTARSNALENIAEMKIIFTKPLQEIISTFPPWYVSNVIPILHACYPFWNAIASNLEQLLEDSIQNQDNPHALLSPTVYNIAEQLARVIILVRSSYSSYKKTILKARKKNQVPPSRFNEPISCILDNLRLFMEFDFTQPNRLRRNQKCFLTNVIERVESLETFGIDDLYLLRQYWVPCLRIFTILTPLLQKNPVFLGLLQQEYSKYTRGKTSPNPIKYLADKFLNQPCKELTILANFLDLVSYKPAKNQKEKTIQKMATRTEDQEAIEYNRAPLNDQVMLGERGEQVVKNALWQKLIYWRDIESSDIIPIIQGPSRTKSSLKTKIDAFLELDESSSRDKTRFNQEESYTDNDVPNLPEFIQDLNDEHGIHVEEGREGSPGIREDEEDDWEILLQAQAEMFEYYRQQKKRKIWNTLPEDGEVKELRSEALPDSHVCKSVEADPGKSVYRYMEKDFFWVLRDVDDEEDHLDSSSPQKPRSKKDRKSFGKIKEEPKINPTMKKTHDYFDVEISHANMLALCQIRGFPKGAANISWDEFEGLVLALGGSIPHVYGSVHTLFIPTIHAGSSIEVHEPHPSTRLDHKVNSIRTILFNKFGIDIHKFHRVK
jgi:hypothetical protein